MDGEIAKALKVFFRDVKGVQKKVAEVKNLGTFIKVAVFVVAFDSIM